RRSCFALYLHSFPTRRSSDLFSSRLTGWPSCLCQSSSVASATDSDNCGTLTSMIAIHFPRSVFPRLPLSFHRVMKNQRVTRRDYCSLLVLTEGLLHQSLLTLVVAGHVAAGR